MTPRTRGIVVSIVVAIGSLQAHAEWTTDYTAALARARAEKKAVLVDLRKGPDAVQDRFIALSEAEGPLARAYRSFVLARVDSTATDKNADVTKLLAQKPPVPSFVVVDPGDTYVTSWLWFDDLSSHLNFLNRARAEMKAIMEAFNVRESGRAGDADVLLADINLRMTHVFRARDLYSKAVDEFLMQSNDAKAQKAAIGVQVAQYMLGIQNASISELRKLIAASTPDVAAAAHLAIGRLYESTGDKKRASSAFHDAFEKAPHNSAEWRAARDELLHLGDRSVLPETSHGATIHIVVPERPTLFGQTAFTAMAEPAIASVQWYLDTKPIRRVDQRPFAMRTNLGAVPRLHSVEAVGYDAQGTPVARAVAAINDRLDELRMHIVSPAVDRAAGVVQIEAEAYVPPGRKLKTVELSWNDQSVGRFSEPPYKAQFDAPPSFGYIRAVGTLDDGQTAEDARVLNSPQASEQFDVHSVAFAATVVDHTGRRINGLGPDDFLLLDGRERAPVTVRDAGGDPVTIGVALDLSSSLTTALLPVMRLGMRLIEAGVKGDDQMFLVTFDKQPRLLQPATGDASLLKSRIQDVTAFGGTALADALAFSMQQFTGLTGKRALVLITDGNEGSSENAAAACMQMAKESGVPIYVIVPQESGDAEGGPAFRKILKQMANATGGLMFLRPKAAEIPAIVNRICDEIRGQYLLSFSAHHAEGDWRTVHVTVPGKAAVVRTVTGYDAR